MTVNVLRGISTSIFFRLCWRAPCTVMRSSKTSIFPCVASRLEPQPDDAVLENPTWAFLSQFTQSMRVRSRTILGCFYSNTNKHSPLRDLRLRCFRLRHEKTLDRVRPRARNLLRHPRIDRHQDLSGKASDTFRCRDQHRRRPYPYRGYRAGAECLAVDGRYGSRIHLGARQLRRAGLDRRLAAS